MFPEDIGSEMIRANFRRFHSMHMHLGADTHQHLYEQKTTGM
jgi:hypothetical protein